jgi:hypothetical protein
MQPKARMTFRFNPPDKPAPRTAEPDPIERPETEPRGTEARGPLPANPAPVRLEAVRPAPASDRVNADYRDAGLLLDDPYTLEELIRNAGPRIPQEKGELGSPQERPDPLHPYPKPDIRQTEADPDAGPLIEPELITREWSGDSPSGSRRGLASYPQSSGPSWWRAFVTVAGAIATGALFGYLVLTLFTGEPVLPDKPGRTAAPAQATAGSGSAPHGSASASADPVGQSDAFAEAPLPGATYYLLQYGVFRSEEGMETALEQLGKKGLPAVADRTDGFRVFAGAAATKEEAELLAAQMPNVQVFIKEMRSAALDADGTTPGGLASYVRRSDDMAKRLAELSTRALQDAMPQPIGDQALISLRESFRQWTDAASSVGGFAEPVREAAGRMARALNAAMVSIDDYSRNASRYHLWRVQADVVEAVLADRDLRSAWTQRAAR